MFFHHNLLERVLITTDEGLPRKGDIGGRRVPRAEPPPLRPNDIDGTCSADGVVVNAFDVGHAATKTHLERLLKAWSRDMVLLMERVTEGGIGRPSVDLDEEFAEVAAVEHELEGIGVALDALKDFLGQHD